jgi:cytochrome c
MRMCERLSLGAVLLFAATAAASAQTPQFGQPISPADLAPWDIESCHERRRAAARQRHDRAGRSRLRQVPSLPWRRAPASPMTGWWAAGFAFAPAQRRCFVGSYWPYATTLFDYVRRAMPGPAEVADQRQICGLGLYPQPQRQSSANDTMNAQTLAKVSMPSRTASSRSRAGRRSRSKT